MHITKNLCLSSNHLRNATKALMRDGNVLPGQVFNNDQIGDFVVTVPPEGYQPDNGLYPAELKTCLEHARSLDCASVHFSDLVGEDDTLDVFE
jgi:hypothetical protein